jgi:cholesterol transport system auxiliary component
MKRLFLPSIRHWTLLLCVFCPGCVSFERSYPEIRYFVIAVSERSSQSNPGGEGVLALDHLRVSPRYSEKYFVYRISESGYESDFYNQFLTAPDLLIGEELRRGLAATEVFKYVIGPSNQQPANYFMEGSVNALYGDFRNLNAPAALLELEFFLHNDDRASPGIVLHKRYLKSVPINARSPEALVKGWNEALSEIISSLAADLKAAKLPLKREEDPATK